jgi:hypothetical protein
MSLGTPWWSMVGKRRAPVRAQLLRQAVMRSTRRVKAQVIHLPPINVFVQQAADYSISRELCPE